VVSREHRFYNVVAKGEDSDVLFKLGRIQASSPSKAAELAFDGELAEVMPAGKYRVIVKCHSGISFRLEMEKCPQK